MKMTENRHKLTWLILGGIGLLYLVLVISILPPRTFFSGDAGVRYLQVHNLIKNRWRALSIEYSGELLDPEHRFSPFSPTAHFYDKNQKTYGVYSDFFVVIVSVFYVLFGFRGLYLVPLLATLGTMVVTYRLSARFSDKYRLLALMMVGLATPMLFYSLDFWEHSLAVFFSTLGVLFLLKGLDDGHGEATRWLFFSGLALGASVWIREELYVMLPAGLLALIWVKRVRCLKALFAYGVGVAVLLVPLWTIEWVHYGSPFGAHVANAADPTITGQDAQVSQNLVVEFLRQRFIAAQLIAPWSSKRWVLVIALVLIGRASLWLVSGTRRRLLLLGLAIGMVISISVIVFLELWHQWRPESLIQSFPLVFFLIFLGALPGSSPESNATRQREVWLIFLIVVAFVGGVCLITPSLGGAQWGARFLLPAYPLLVVLIVYTLQQCRQWNFSWPWSGVAVLLTFILLLGLSVVIQLAGIIQLKTTKMDYERLMVATEQVEPEVIVTDLWWLSQVIAPVLSEKTLFLIEHSGNDSLTELLPRLYQHEVQSFTFVTTPNLSQAQVTSIAAENWMEQARHVEQIWLQVDFITYRYNASTGQGPSTR